MFFPVDFNTEKRECEMTDCWLNKYFFWLFEFLNDFAGFLAELFFDSDYMFAVRFYGKNRNKLKAYLKDNPDFNRYEA